MKLTGSQIFVEVLVEQGVDTLFGYPGGAVLNLYDELYKNSDRIRHVLTAHEQGASHAADGYARATGRTGVVLATSGPAPRTSSPASPLPTWTACRWLPSPATLPRRCWARTLSKRPTLRASQCPSRSTTTRCAASKIWPTRCARPSASRSPAAKAVLVDIPKDVTAAVCEFTPKAPELIRTVTHYNEDDVKRPPSSSTRRSAPSSTSAAASAARQAASRCATCWKRPACPPPIP